MSERLASHPLPSGGVRSTPDPASSYGPLSDSTRAAILALVEREALATARHPEEAARAIATARNATRARLSEAGLALLAATVREPALARAARRRYRSLVGHPVQDLLGWRSIRDVARAAGMTHQAVASMLRGETDPPVSSVSKVAIALGVPVARVVEHLRHVQRNPIKPKHQRPRLRRPFRGYDWE